MLRVPHRVLLVTLLLMVATPSLWAQQRSDLELLREASFEPPRSDRHHPYGIEPGRKTLSPLYHAASGALWVWENHLAPDTTTPGGYTDTNIDYFRDLVAEYGTLPALLYGLDRTVRNTKIGRTTAPKNERGLVGDDPKRYRR